MVSEEETNEYEKFFEKTFNKIENPIQENYMGRLQELIIKFIGWKMDYQYAIAGGIILRK